MIIVLCGPPASGKSAIAGRLVEELEDSRLVTSDEFKRKTYRRMFAETERSAGRVKYLVLDGTFYKKLWRDRIKEIGGRKGEEVFTVHVACSLKTCLERNRLRERPIVERAIHIIYNQFEGPVAADLLIDTDVLSINEAVEMILRALSGRV